MTTKYIDFKESTITELTNFIQSQARAVSLADLDRLMIDLPALREASPGFRRGHTPTSLTSSNSSVCSSRSGSHGGAATWRKSQWRRRRSRCSIFSGRLI